MLSLDKLGRRTRTRLEDVDCFCYDDSVTKGGLISHPHKERLWFAERDDVKGLVEELGKMDILRRHIPDYVSLDDRVKYVRIGEGRYPVYLCGGTKVAQPVCIREVKEIADRLCQALQIMHRQGWVMWNICPRAIYQPPYRIGPTCAVAMRKAAFEGIKGSIILGSSIPSPYQVLLDMLSSKFEAMEIPFEEFKKKFVFFWGRVLPPDFRHVPDVCQLYHSMKNGSTDYVDSILCKWCKIEQKAGKQYIIKDPTNLLKPSMMSCIDWFGLGITLDTYLDQIIENDPSVTTPDDLISLIQTCISMEEPLNNNMINSSDDSD